MTKLLSTPEHPMAGITLAIPAKPLVERQRGATAFRVVKVSRQGKEMLGAGALYPARAFPFADREMLNKIRYPVVMRDSDVRAAVRDWLQAHYADDSRIVEEMGIWSGTVRIDIAVINGELHGFELKSERDTLTRLQDQAELYSQVFDRMTLVVADRHHDKAISKIPQWWGITTARFEGDAVALCSVKEAERNPSIDPMQLARLLWRPEALEILERRGLSRGYKSRTADVIATRLVEVLSFSELSAEVRETLKTRAGWLGKPVGDERQMPIGGVGSPLRSTAGRSRPSGDLLDSIISPAID